MQFEIQTLLLKIREYKKNNSFALNGDFSKQFNNPSVSILDYTDEDEQVQIAIINFYSKLIYYDISKQQLIQMIEQVNKMTQVNNIFIEKKLKFIRNAFEYAQLDGELLLTLYQLNKSVEALPNLYYKESAREQLSLSLKKLALNCSMDLIEVILEQLSHEIHSYLSADTIKLIEYPYQILYFIIHKRNPQNFINLKLIPLLIQLVRLDHPVLWNYLNQITLHFINDPVLIRVLLGQVILRQIESQISRINNLGVMEVSLPCEWDTHFLVNVLLELFNSQERVRFLYKHTDMNPLFCEIFHNIVLNIFELSKAAQKLQSDEGKQLQKNIYSLQIQLFRVGLTRKSQQNIQEFRDFLNNFQEDPRKSIKQLTKHQVVLFLKYCTQFKETLMIEILGCHKENCVDILQGYIETFDFQGLSIVGSLRLLSSNFLLFGESQMIERVLNYFTLQHYEQNQNSVFKHPDYMFTYTYALILLNTDLYNKTVTKHMSLEDFVRNCEKINGGESLPLEVLKQDYQSILDDEILCTRDFARSPTLSQFVWEKAQRQQQVQQQAYQELFETFHIKIDEEHFGDLILTQTVHNLEDMVQNTLNHSEEELKNLLEQLITVCIQNDRLDNAQQMLMSMVKISKDKPNMVQVAFVIAEQLLPYTNSFDGIVMLIVDTINLLQVDSINRECRSILLKIQNNNKFIKKNMGSKKGIFNLFQQYLQQEQEDSGDDEIEVLDLKSNYIQNLITQTKYLDSERLNDFVNQLLAQINTSDHIKFAQIIYMAVEILRVNTDRMLPFWSKVVSILRSPRQINHKKQLVQSYCDFILFKLVIEFLHQASQVEDYDQCFQIGLTYISDQSLEILFEFLQEIQKFLKQNSSAEFSVKEVQNIVILLLKILNTLEQKNLDKNDAEILMDYIQDIFERIQLNDKDVQILLQIYSEVLTALLRQKQLRSVASVDDFIAKHTLQIMNNYEKFIYEQNNKLLNELMTLACNLQIEYLNKVVQIMMQSVLNYNYKLLTAQDFHQIFNQFKNKQKEVLQQKNDQIIVTFAQYFQKLYFNWINEERFQIRIWLDFLIRFTEIFACLRFIKSPVVDSLQICLESACLDPHFQDILKSNHQYDIIEQSQDVKDKTVYYSKILQIQIIHNN